MNALTTTHSIPEVERMALAIAESGLFGIKTPQQAFALMLIAQAEGRHPATVAQEYDIIQGRPALKAQAALSRFQAAGGRIQWTERSATACAAEFAHPQGGTLVIRWDIARAHAAQLTGKENWKKFPDQMLSARVVAEGVRAVFPACLNGVYLAEEVQDFEPHQRPAGVEVTQSAPEKPKARLIPTEKAHTLVERARAIGYADEAIAAAIGTNLDAVTVTAAKAFFAIVEAEERDHESRMQETHSHDEDAHGVPENA
jgi:hypothetical protein